MLRFLTLTVIIVVTASTINARPHNNQKHNPAVKRFHGKTSELIIQGRKLIINAIVKQRKESSELAKKIIKKKSKATCRKNLFKICFHEIDCGCHLKCQNMPFGPSRCMPTFGHK